MVDLKGSKISHLWWDLVLGRLWLDALAAAAANFVCGRCIIREKHLRWSISGRRARSELVCFGEKGIYLCVVPMRSFYFEKYCTWINAVTQSWPTASSNTIYEAESGVISDPNKIPHWNVLVSSILEFGNDFKLSPQEAGFLSLVQYLSKDTWIWILLNGDKRFIVGKTSNISSWPPLIMRGARFRVWILDAFITTIENAKDMQGNGETAALDPSHVSEKKRPGSSMPVGVAAAVPRILIPWISTMSSSQLLLTLTVVLLLLLPSRHCSLWHLQLDLLRLLRTRQQCEWF